MRALQVDADGTLSAHEIDGSNLTTIMDGINDRLGSDWYDVIDVFGNGIDLFVDDEAAVPTASRPAKVWNQTMSLMVQHAGRPAIYHGGGLFLGHDEDGNPAGLTDEQQARIVGWWCSANRPHLPQLIPVAALSAH